MKLFVDECVNRHLLRHVTGHTFVHARNTPLRSTQNGALLRAVAPEYDVFPTRDKGIPFQQNLGAIHACVRHPTRTVKQARRFIAARS
jgi:hypothetical protein